MIRTILFPTGGAPPNAAAQQSAIVLARRFKAHITALGLVDAPWITRPQPSAIGAAAFHEISEAKQLKRARRQSLHALRRIKQAAGRSVSITTAAFELDPLDTIMAEAHAHDLIVMGRKTSFRYETEVAVSALLKGVIRECARPVLAISSRPVAAKRIIVAFDGSTPASRAMHMAALLGFLEGSKVRVVSVDPERRGANALAERAATLLRNHDIGAEAVGVESTMDPAKIILRQVRAFRAGLVVMGAYGHGGLRDVVFGSCTRGLLADCRPAILVQH